MTRLVFTPQLRRFVDTPELGVDVPTVRAALEAAFECNPKLRGYVLDHQAHLRANVFIFVDGRLTAWFTPGIKNEKRLPVDAALCVTRSRDGGQSFEALRVGPPQQHCYDLIYRHGLAVDESGERLLMGSTTGNLWASDDAGDSWQTVSLNLPPIYPVRFGS